MTTFLGLALFVFGLEIFRRGVVNRRSRPNSNYRMLIVVGVLLSVMGLEMFGGF